MPRNAKASKKGRRDKFDFRQMIDRSGHDHIIRLMEKLHEIDGYVEKLPALSSGMLGVHLTMMEVQLEEHRKWCEWLTQPPEAQAAGGKPEGGASPASDVCTTARAAASESDADPAPPRATADEQHDDGLRARGSQKGLETFRE